MPEVLFSPPPRLGHPSGPNTDLASSPQDSSSDDPFDVESEEADEATEDDDLRRNTVGNTRMNDSNRSAASTTPSSEVSKPFGNVAFGIASTSKTASGGPESADTFSKSKPNYSVDEFTALLMTGKSSKPDSAPGHSSPVSSHTPQIAGDSSSNTDASSISRQSIFEPPPDPRHETPRTSQEITISDDERHSFEHTPPRNERFKPETPRSHHGRLVSESSSLPQHELSSPVATPRSSYAPAEMWSSIYPSNPTDLNKPLPIPPTHEPSENAPPGIQTFKVTTNTDQDSDASNRKKEPPTLPSTRRLGQVESKSLSASANRSAPVSVGISSSINATTSTSSNLAAKVPPPPPPRRPGPTRGQSTSSTTSGISMIHNPSSSTFSDDSSQNASKNKPPVPPARRGSGSSTKRHSTLPAQLSISGVPPTPPPRRRGSSQSSFGPSQLSGEYQPSTSERQRADSGASSVQSRDVIADLSALQKEVDELRGKFGT